MPRPAALPPPLPVPAAAAAAEVSFRNPAAVRTALLGAAIGIALQLLPVPFFLKLVWQLTSLAAGGFIAVYLFSRRTRALLSVRGGARLGWITGVFCFVMVTILLTLSFAALSTSDELAASYRRQLAEQAPGVDVEQALAVVQSPVGVVVVLLMAFLLSTFLPLVGGALGAKVLEKD